jgi:hypothetical protein
LSQNIEETQSFNEYTTWSSMNWAHYKWTDTVLIGVGAGGGYTVQDFGSDMTFQQLQGRIAWNPTEKLGFSLNGGMEFRQFVDSEFDAQVNPIGGASVSYTPWEPTTFSLSARHSVGSSVVRAQTTKRSTVSAGVRQRFLERFHVSLYGSYRHKEYTGLHTATVISEEATRSDDSVSFSANLGFRVFTKGDVSIFYQGSRNDSSFDNFTFTSNQYGAQISYHF